MRDESGGARRGHWETRDGLSRWVSDDPPPTDAHHDTDDRSPRARRADGGSERSADRPAADDGSAERLARARRAFRAAERSGAVDDGRPPDARRAAGRSGGVDDGRPPDARRAAGRSGAVDDRRPPDGRRVPGRSGGVDDEWPPELRRADAAAGDDQPAGGSFRDGGGERAGRGRRGRRPSDARETPKPPADPVAHAKEICLNLLTARPRTRAELRTQLLKRGVEEAVADQVLSRLDEVGLIDDAAFAELWVRSRHTYQGMARRALSAELRRRGVADELAAAAVSTLDGEAEEARARELVRKRMRAMGSVEDLTKIRRLVGMLARKGYAEGLAYRVVRDELRAEGADTDALDSSLPE